MRAVDKGEAPGTEYKKYQDAEPELEARIGAYLYDCDVPRLNEEYLDRKGTQEKEKADKLFQLLKLDHIPITPKDKDRRYRARNEARNYAIISKNGLKKMHTYPEREAYLEMIKNLALESGFFSVWMEIFKDDDEVKKILISSFKGTKEEFCGEIE